MKSAIDWFKEKGFTFNDKITIRDIIVLQNDARRQGIQDAIDIFNQVGEPRNKLLDYKQRIDHGQLIFSAMRDALLAIQDPPEIKAVKP